MLIFSLLTSTSFSLNKYPIVQTGIRAGVPVKSF
jgi:hypothetical protein